MLDLKLPNQLSQLAHAYILEASDSNLGQHLASQLANTLLCQNTEGQLQPACGHCHSCQLFSAQNHPDLFSTDKEQASTGIDEVRQLSEFLTKTSQLSGNQVVIVNNANSMTENASNALLKTLEEPTGNSFIILLCQRKSQLMPTILSRCQFVSISNSSKVELQQQYPEVPDYLIGFSQGASSKISGWIDSEKLPEFQKMYETFIAWLKHNCPDHELTELANEKELEAFLLYLFGRRLFQLAKKQQNNAFEAQNIMAQYQKNTQAIAGINRKLALNSLLLQLKPLIS